MARITEFATPSPRPEEGGAPQAAAEISGGIYKGIGSGLHDIGEALQRRGEQQETSQLHVGLANAQTQAFSDWENLKQNGDITDPETLQKFNEDFSNKISSLTDNISSPDVRNHANELIAEAQGGMVRRTLTDHAMAVGEQAQANYRQIVNDFSSLAASDPTFYEDGAKQIDMMVAASGLPSNKIPEAQLQARQELARSTIKGAGESLDPGYINQMVVELKSGRFDEDLNEDQKATQLKFLTARQEEADRVQKASKLLDKQQAEQVANSATSEYQQQLVDPKTNFLQWSKAVLSDHRFDQNPEKRDSLIRFGHFQIMEPILQQERDAREARAEASSNRAAASFEARENNKQRSDGFWNAWTHVNSGEIDSPTQINDLATRGIIGLKDVNILQGELAKRKKAGPDGDSDAPLSKNFYDGAREKLKDWTSSAGDPFHDNFASVWQLDQAERQNGIPASERYDRKSPKYVGKAFDQALDNAAGPTTLDNAKPAIPAKPFAISDLDKIAKGAVGAQAGQAAVRGAYQAGRISREAAERELITRGWAKPK